MAHSWWRLGGPSVVRNTTEQTFTEDFLDPKKPQEKRCQLIHSTPYLCNAVMGAFFLSRQPRESDPRADRTCLLRERSRETPFCARNLKRVSAFDAQLCNRTNVCSPMPHRSGRTEFFSRPQ